ncbi:glycosyltransferase family 4 protein [Flavobacterium soli]|uniref:glycosyltransferase family 4 protein n=1 Tax=Flavobacterium soli TaxID=344881 RepID=UPI0003F86C90|nr:glycosyltransferase family 4 protein [Flavobacterium soli]
MIKIAFLTPEYPHTKFGPSGGIGTSIKNLASGLISAENKVVIVIYGQKQDEVFEENGIVFYCVKNIKIKGLSWYFTRKKIENLINTLYSEKKIDLVEAPDWTGITSFIQPKCPIVIRQHGTDTYFCHLDRRNVRYFNRFHEKRALKKADAVISVSQFTGNLTNILFELDIEFTVIPNSVDTDFFKDFKIDATNGSEILYFGSLIRKKGLLELPYIFNKVIEHCPDAKLTLIGQDVPDVISVNSSTWKMMQETFTEKTLESVIYLGSVNYDVIKEHILKADVCVFPSFAEALPVSWLEAMAMKKAIVASNIGWASEIIEDGTEGFLVDPKSHEQYANKIVELLEYPGLRKQFGEKAREKVANKFAVKNVTQSNIDFYNHYL